MKQANYFHVTTLVLMSVSWCCHWCLGRWWTPWWVWLSYEASPWRPSGHSSPVRPLCKALSRPLQAQQLQTHPPPQAQEIRHCYNLTTIEQLSAFSNLSYFRWPITWSRVPHITCKGAVMRCKCSCKAYLEFSPTISIKTEIHIWKIIKTNCTFSETINHWPYKIEKALMVNCLFQTFMIKVIMWKPNIHQSLKNLIQKKQMNRKINKRC